LENSEILNISEQVYESEIALTSVIRVFVCNEDVDDSNAKNHKNCHCSKIYVPKQGHSLLLRSHARPNCHCRYTLNFNSTLDGLKLTELEDFI